MNEETPQPLNRLDKIEAILENLAQSLVKSDEVFEKRIAALLGRHEALTARHEALSESVEMLVDSWFRKNP